MLSEKRKVAILEQYVEREATSTDYSGEMSFYSYVKQGQTAEVRQRLDEDSFAMNTKKKLSADPIQSIRYHFVVTAGLLPVSALKAVWRAIRHTKCPTIIS